MVSLLITATCLLSISEPPDVVDQVLARATVVQSGKITFDHVWNKLVRREDEGFEVRGVTVLDSGEKISHLVALQNVNTDLIKKSQGNRENNEASRFELVFAGAEWALHSLSDTARNTRLSRVDLHGIYTEGRSRDNSMPQPTLLLQSTEKVDHEEQEYDEFLLDVTRCGTVPCESMLNFIRSRRDDFEFAAEQSSTFPDDVILDLPVHQRDFNAAFKGCSRRLGGALPNYLYSGEFATLRLHVAPNLGFAIRKIEFVSSRNVSWYHIVSTDFQEIVDGIFFPSTCTLTCEGAPNCWERIYRLNSVENLNAVIDESEFGLQLPTNTRIRSTIKNKMVLFRLDDEARLDNLDSLIPQARRVSPSVSPSGGTFTKVCIANLAALIIVIYLRWRRTKI